MKRGFTLIEMMIALSIAAIIMAAILGLLSSVWLLAKESSDELQFALRARSLRERIFYDLKDGYGLITAPEIDVSAEELRATLHQDSSGKKLTFSSLSSEADEINAALDKSTSVSYPEETAHYRYVRLKIKNGTDENKRGYVVYHDRLVVPLFGGGMTMEEFSNAFKGQ